jgi:hypothetical protein
MPPRLRAASLCGVASSEGQPSSDLPVARQLLGCGFAEGAAGVGQIAVESGEVHAVKGVEELKPDLEVQMFGKLRRFVCVEVGFGEVGLPKAIGLPVALAAEASRNRELSGIEGSVQKSLLRLPWL